MFTAELISRILEQITNPPSLTRILTESRFIATYKVDYLCAYVYARVCACISALELNGYAPAIRNLRPIQN